MDYISNYNEEFGCFEVLEWDNEWIETGWSFELEDDAIQCCKELQAKRDAFLEEI